jgi:hypothetical protein
MAKDFALYAVIIPDTDPPNRTEFALKESLKMDIYRNQPHGLTVLQAIQKRGTQRPPAAEESAAPPRKPLNDRRLQPDRRRAQIDFKGPDRRRKRSRRSPRILHHPTRQATPTEDRRGRMVSTRA